MTDLKPAPHILEEPNPATDPARQAMLLRGYRAMVIGRRFDEQATNLAKQGYLTVYPSSYGQEACQIGAVLGLRETDWLFPTYRDTMSIVSRGVDPGRALTLMRGDWHCGYDPTTTRVAPQCTPLSTQCSHAVGLAMAARMTGDDLVAVVLCGDGATSEGDFHEGLNLAAVFSAPVVFLVQNNGYAISVPQSMQTKAPTLAAKAIGYGMPGNRVDGNDLAAVDDAMATAIGRARRGDGPSLIEAMTYRIGPHTNADDPSRYRHPGEADGWKAKDPIGRLAVTLRSRGILDCELQTIIDDEARQFAERTRHEVMTCPQANAGDLFSHVYHATPRHLETQAAAITGALT